MVPALSIAPRTYRKKDMDLQQMAAGASVETAKATDTDSGMNRSFLEKNS